MDGIHDRGNPLVATIRVELDFVHGDSPLTGITPAEHNYASGLWPRVGFVNLAGVGPWDGDPTEPWRCACHKRPEFSPAPDNVHPLKSQGYEQIINVCMADGSVHALSSSISDFNYFVANTPAAGDIPTDPQVP